MKKALLLVVITLITVNLTQAQLPSYVPQNGLSAWWGMNGNANDASPNNNNGSMYGVNSIQDRFGNPSAASYFNGTALSYIHVPHHNSIDFDATDEYTISLWVKPENNASNGHAGILSKWEENYSTPYPYNIRLLDLGEDAKVFWQNHTSSTTIKADAIIPKYSYTHILVTVRNQKAKLYINNMLLDSAYFSSATVSNTNDLYIGKRYTTSPRRYKGAIDDIGIWSRVLTACERQALYQGKSLQIIQQPSDTTASVGSSAAFNFQYTDSVQATFQWQKSTAGGFQDIVNNATYSGTTKDTLYINSVNSSMNNTFFRCVITNGSCSDTTAAAKLMLPNSVNAHDANKWNIYPNPTEGQLFIELLEANTSPFHLRIYNINGALLRAYTYPAHTSTTSISLQGMDAGIYLLEMETKNTVFRNKIIHY